MLLGVIMAQPAAGVNVYVTEEVVLVPRIGTFRSSL